MAEKEWPQKQEIKLHLAEKPKSLKELSKALDKILMEYDGWLQREKKDSPLIPYERNAIKTFLLRQYMLS